MKRNLSDLARYSLTVTHIQPEIYDALLLTNLPEPLLAMSGLYLHVNPRSSKGGSDPLSSKRCKYRREAWRMTILASVWYHFCKNNLLIAA